MNNQQFRRLVLDTPARASKDAAAATPRREDAGPSLALGSRMRSSMPMTPRTVVGSGGVDFARQLRERDGAPPAKKFRSSAAPKGTRLAAGYQDRTQLRSAAEDDEVARRVQALEDMVKLGQMEHATFEALRDQITGGDVRHVHLVKGLDFKLLERVRRGEDVLADVESTVPAVPEEEKHVDDDADIEEAFDDLESKEVAPLIKEDKPKTSSMAPPSMPTKKRTRDEILADWKASRAEAKQAAMQPSLGARFKKVGQKQETSRIERDARGREVLVTVDADGNVKRKIRKSAPASTAALLQPDKDVAPLGMDVPIAPVPVPIQDPEDMDIFEGAGKDYDPLGGLDADSASEDEEAPAKKGHEHVDSVAKERTEEGRLEHVDSEAKERAGEDGHEDTDSEVEDPIEADEDKKQHKPVQSEELVKKPVARNYFADSTASTEAVPYAAPANPQRDPSILAALKRASALASSHAESTRPPATAEEAEAAARRKRMLLAHDRDADDLDLGFGSSRFEDQEEGEDRRPVKLSTWRDGDAADSSTAPVKRKRGPKKRKGDKDNVADVLRVIERQKGEQSRT